MDITQYMCNRRFVSPFPTRPWMDKNGAAAAASGQTGLKGIVAGGITGGDFF